MVLKHLTLASSFEIHNKEQIKLTSYIEAYLTLKLASSCDAWPIDLKLLAASVVEEHEVYVSEIYMVGNTQFA